MVTYRIRVYQDSDYQSVRDLYVSGVHQHFHRVCCYVLKQPVIQASVAVCLCLLLVLSRSLLLSLCMLALLLVLGRLFLKSLWNLLIHQNLRSDLLDICASYNEQPGARFWVAQWDDVVIGTVGAAPSDNSSTDLELKRLNVHQEYRGRGIAKDLCRTVHEFAHLSGFTGIVLRTSVIQTEAQQLYRKLGYRLVGTTLVPHAFAKLINYTIYKYHYQLTTGPLLQQN
ncbi:probable N-acetyltransferase camello [Stegostoma tigrinum]|uniref:probable N-acetyltransferase camello n=1 Tax=Stegostoma tigrinum TaxID=3053191 RepID=UPI00202B190D|nr:probable N-acetyltransferase camello [Stegostoma tigrinum]XP_059506785.1 probable N-acetyltransferase camello [Stegostoma tigrinum]XP_059506786.1 probable N-acetyltransferase camello [Stegostoma tigrinum]XP_059506793.1 probable N-acetyltransferase camello [Stegostoma tigrinum]XP_059506795.1 probable N-acetyltransferase camello [Stegostoma tigrinum]XP_059506796.1 probable N-acetyltransferase camello [Stegostoma tigrinum]XP_059506799.1 probable N-acetyltransferase camello [Stegostoma tigrinu